MKIKYFNRVDVLEKLRQKLGKVDPLAESQSLHLFLKKYLVQCESMEAHVLNILQDSSASVCRGTNDLSLTADNFETLLTGEFARCTMARAQCLWYLEHVDIGPDKPAIWIARNSEKPPSSLLFAVLMCRSQLLIIDDSSFPSARVSGGVILAPDNLTSQETNLIESIDCDKVLVGVDNTIPNVHATYSYKAQVYKYLHHPVIGPIGKPCLGTYDSKSAGILSKEIEIVDDHGALRGDGQSGFLRYIDPFEAKTKLTGWQGFVSGTKLYLQISIAPPQLFIGRNSMLDLTTIKRSLLREGLILDIEAVQRRTDSDLISVHFVYVPRIAGLEKQINSILREKMSTCNISCSVSSVSTIPRTRTGLPNMQWIAKLPTHLLDETLQVMEELGPADKLHLSEILPWNNHFRSFSATISSSQSRLDVTQSMDSSVIFGDDLITNADDPSTLAQSLERTAERFPFHTIVTYQTESDQQSLIYQDLYRHAKKISGGLQANGVPAGSKVLLQISNIQNLIVSFWGCILSGNLPVIVAVPDRYDPANAVCAKLINGAKLFDECVLICDTSQETELRQLFNSNKVRILNYCQLRNHNKEGIVVHRQSADPAFLQLSSGSTGTPKCVIETNQSVIAHAQGVGQMNSVTSADVSFNWLGFDHVGALLMGHITDTFHGSFQVHVKTETVLRRPTFVFDIITKHRVTLTWCPNFGLKLISEEIASKGAEWDLSSIRHWLNGGEQVTRSVVEDFVSATKPFGFRPDRLQPAYGMAEVATGVVYNNKFSFENSFYTPSDGVQATFISCGKALPGVSIRIVDDQDHLIPQGAIGRIQVKGHVVMPNGYLSLPLDDLYTKDGWFNTGDQGLILNDSLYPTGRLKEIIIIRGSNMYCYEIEDTVSRVEGVAPSFVAAVSVRDANQGTEQLIVVYVPKLNYDPSILHQKIQDQLVRSFGLSAHYIIPMPQDEFPKTTSGKIQRSKLQENFLRGDYKDLIVSLEKKLDIDEQLLPKWFFTQKLIAAPLPEQPAILDDHTFATVAFEQLSLPGCHIIGRFRDLKDLTDAFDVLIVDFTSYASLELWEQIAYLRSIAEAPADKKYVVAIEIPGSSEGSVRRTLSLFIQTLRAEKPEIDFRAIVLDNTAHLQDIIQRELMADSLTPVVCYQNLSRFIDGIVEVDLQAEHNQIQSWQPLGDLVLLGGSGGIGQHLIDRYIKTCKRIVVLGRGEIPDQFHRKFAKHLDNGRLVYLTVDFTNPESVVSQLLASIPDFKPEACIHLTGLYEGISIQDITRDSLDRLLQAKLVGVCVARKLLNTFENMHFVLFSSVNGTFAGTFSLPYSLANMASELEADSFRKDGRTVTVVQWSMWEKTGIAREFESAGGSEKSGFFVLDPNKALMSMDAIMGKKLTHVMIGLDKRRPTISHAMRDTVRMLTRYVHHEDVSTYSKDAYGTERNVNSKEVYESETSQNALDSATEMALGGIWQNILDLGSQPKRTDNFFALGGHSIAAVKLIAKIEHALSTKINISDVFTSKDLSSLANLIDTKSKQRTPVALPTRHLPSEVKHLTPQQRNMWFLDKLFPHDTAYHIYQAYASDRIISSQHLTEALKQFMERNPSLMSRFPAAADGTPFFDFNLELLQTFTIETGEANQEDLDTKIKDIIERPFDLEKGPLFRVGLIKSSANIIVFSFHHIIGDGESLELFEEFLDAYLSGSPTPSRTYGSYLLYANRQLQYLQSDKCAEDLDAWVEALLPYREKINLPTIPASVQSNHAKVTSTTLDGTLTESIRKQCRQHSITLNSFFFAVFALLLDRSTSQSGFIIGVPISLRETEEDRNTFGLYTGTMPVPVNIVASDSTFFELARTVQNSLGTCFNRSRVPVDLIVEKLGVRREVGKNPLFDIMFAYFKANTTVTSSNLRRVPATIDTTKFDLTLFVYDSSTTVDIEFSFKPSVYDSDTIDQLKTAFIKLVAELTRFDEPIKHSLARSFPLEPIVGPNLLVDSRQLVPFMLQDKVRQHGDELAILDEGKRYTFQDIGRDVLNIRRGLNNKGIKKGDCVVIVGSRSYGTIVTMLAMLEASVCYIPIDEDSIPRMSYIIADAEPTCLIVTRDIPFSYPLEIASYSLAEVLKVSNNGDPDESSPNADDPAYIIFTSGSTGVPKGVVIHQGALANYLASCGESYMNFGGQGTLLHASISFDMSITSIFLPLICGQAIEIAGQSKSDPLKTECFAKVQAKAFIKTTPGHFDLLQQIYSADALANMSNHWILGGERLSYSQIAPSQSITYTNEYGPTEATVGCVAHSFTYLGNKQGSVPIGKPLANCSLLVVDSSGQQTLPGFSGELLIGGPQVSYGYLNRDDENAKRFITGLNAADGYFYRTGDLVELHAHSGLLQYIKRSDSQTKFRGYRIELEEVEHAVRQLAPAGSQAVVRLEEEGKNTHLVLYLKTTHSVDADAIMSVIGERLPAYMVPTLCVMVDSIPLTANGKIDGEALSEQLNQYKAKHSLRLKPSGKSADHVLLRETWMTVLSHDRFSDQQSFFEVGGNSIKVIRLVHELKHQVGLERAASLFSIVWLFQFPTVEKQLQQLSKYLHQGDRALADDDFLV